MLLDAFMLKSGTNRLLCFYLFFRLKCKSWPFDSPPEDETGRENVNKTGWNDGFIVSMVVTRLLACYDGNTAAVFFLRASPTHA